MWRQYAPLVTAFVLTFPHEILNHFQSQPMHLLLGMHSMPAEYQLVFLLASHEPDLLRAAEAALRATGARVEIALSAEDVLVRIVAPAPLSPVLDLMLLDPRLPGMPPTQLLAAARAESIGMEFPIVLFSDSATPEWTERMAEGVIHDVIPISCGPDFLRLRVDRALYWFRQNRELEQLRETVANSVETDPLTGVQNRTALLAALFRETDRAQRMNTPLSMILLDVDDFGHWNLRLGSEICDRLLVEVAQRTTRLLRTYDLFGRTGKDEFLALLPGCSMVNAVLLAERIRAEVFSAPFHLAGHAVRLSGCFGVAASAGRSPVIVLREAEEALRLAKEEGPESIRCTGDGVETLARPVTFLSPTSDEDLLAW
jgi:two-component system, cell cycle response regulator